MKGGESLDRSVVLIVNSSNCFILYFLYFSQDFYFST